jgi:hypothetical protein
VSEEKLLNEKLAVVQKLMEMKRDLEDTVPKEPLGIGMREKALGVLRDLDSSFKKVKV